MRKSCVRLWAEFVGSFIVAVTACVTAEPSSSRWLIRALCIGALGALVLVLPDCTFNPVCAVALFVSGRVSISQTLYHMAMQMLGAMLAALMVAR
jgi:glycerol uptake facilitator-like aquaporin